ncbi:MAG: hypothetical protein ACJ8KX_00155 [Chthoniobacterales bacterium]
MLVNKPTPLMRARLTNRVSGVGLRLAAVALGILLAACGSGKSPTKNETPSVTAPVYVGSISSVSRESHFVLIDLSATSAPPVVGTELTAISASGEASRLKVTAERKRPFVTADIVSGEPKRGERVYR